LDRACGNSELLHSFQEGEKSGRGITLIVLGRLRLSKTTHTFGLHFEVSLDVVVSSFRTGMTEKQGDDLDRDTGLEERHRTAIPEAVRGYPPAFERRTLVGGLTDGQAETEGDAIVAERAAAAVGKDPSLWGNPIVPAPLTKQSCRPCPDRDFSLLPSLPVELNGTVPQIFWTKLESLGDPSPGVVKQQEKEEVAPPGPCTLVGGGEDGVYFLAGHEPEHPLGTPFLRYGQYPLAGGEKVQPGRLTQDEAYKGSYRGEADVACANGIAAGALQMIEKGEDSLGGEGSQGELIDLTALMLGEKSHQKPKRGPIAGPGFDAQVALCRQVIGEKTLHQSGEIVRLHRRAPFSWNRRKEWAAA
jgi:hypothetical protein